MRNTHTLTHKSSNLLAHNFLIFCIVLAVGIGLPVTLVLCANPFYTLFTRNHTSLHLIEVQNAGSFHSYLCYGGKVGSRQPLTFKQITASQPQNLIGRGHRIDATLFYLRSLLSQGLGRVKPVSTGKPAVHNVSGAPYFFSDSDDGEEVAGRSQFPNPQSTLSQTIFKEAQAASLKKWHAKAFSIDSQVLIGLETQVT